MRTLLLFLFQMVIVITAPAQTKTEDDIQAAFMNAKKGVYWALENIPEKKQKIENDLIADDILIASVKLEKEINGIKITSAGFYLSNEVTVIIYKSTDSLISEGYLVEKKEEEVKSDSEQKSD